MGFLGSPAWSRDRRHVREAREDLEGIILPNEPVEVAFKVVRDLFVFTDKRLIWWTSRASPAGRSITW